MAHIWSVKAHGAGAGVLEGDAAFGKDGGRTGERRWSEEELKKALEEGLSRGEKLKALSTELARRAGWAGQDVYRLGLSLKR